MFFGAWKRDVLFDPYQALLRYIVDIRAEVCSFVWKFGFSFVVLRQAFGTREGLTFSVRYRVTV